MARRILVIEDNKDIALVVKTTLSLRGYDVLTAADGMRGIELAVSDPPDLVILDVLMPEMDGYEVIRRLKADEATASVPVALFSAHMDSNDRDMALKLGAVAVLHKPFEPREFADTVARLIAGKT